MKKIKLAALFTVFILSSLGVVIYFAKPDDVPTKNIQLLDDMEKKQAVDFQTETISGETLQLSDYKGKVIIVNFWASWCDPCIEEFPSMLKLIEQFKGEVVMVAISKDYEEKELTKFLNVFQADSPHLKVAWDQDNKISETYQISALPESFVIGKDFKLKRKVPGSEDWYTPEAIEFFDLLVKNQPL